MGKFKNIAKSCTILTAKQVINRKIQRKVVMKNSFLLFGDVKLQIASIFYQHYRRQEPAFISPLPLNIARDYFFP